MQLSRLQGGCPVHPQALCLRQVPTKSTHFFLLPIQPNQTTFSCHLQIALMCLCFANRLCKCGEIPFENRCAQGSPGTLHLHAMVPLPVPVGTQALNESMIVGLYIRYFCALEHVMSDRDWCNREKRREADRTMDRQTKESARLRLSNLEAMVGGKQIAMPPQPAACSQHCAVILCLTH